MGAKEQDSNTITKTFQLQLWDKLSQQFINLEYFNILITQICALDHRQQQTDEESC